MSTYGKTVSATGQGHRGSLKEGRRVTHPLRFLQRVGILETEQQQPEFLVGFYISEVTHLCLEISPESRARNIEVTSRPYLIHRSREICTSVCRRSVGSPFSTGVNPEFGAAPVNVSKL